MPDQKAAEWVRLDDLIPWDDNPVEHGDHDVPRLVSLMKAHGFMGAMSVHRESMKIVAGHGRRLAVLRLLAEKPEHTFDGAPGPGFVPVRFYEGSWKMAVRAAIAENLAGDGRRYDQAIMRRIAAEALEQDGGAIDRVVATTAFDARYLQRVLRGKTPPGQVPEPAAPEPPREPVSKVGEVYQLGPHRLACGDSSDPEVWDALLEGESLNGVWCDPPYGVGYEQKVADLERAGARTANRTHSRVANDEIENRDQLRGLWMGMARAMFDRCVPGAAWHVAHPGGDLSLIFRGVLYEIDPSLFRHEVVWVKDRFVLGRGDRHYQHEDVTFGWTPLPEEHVLPDFAGRWYEHRALAYGWKGGAAHTWLGGRKRSIVIVVAKPKTSKFHPTMKPLELIEECIGDTSQAGDLIADCCGGSGQTLLACARLERAARLCELEPGYADVIRHRWTRWAEAAGQDPGPGALIIEGLDD